MEPALSQSTVSITSPRCSLATLLGPDYVQAVVEARAFLTQEDPAQLLALAREEIDFFPVDLQGRLAALLEQVGQPVAPAINQTTSGAGTLAFKRATQTRMAPTSALGFIRIGEDGRAYLTSKSEHYHASLGHSFPGYRLIELARRLGVPNATHNNTRGYITRRLEEDLIRAANGLGASDKAGLERVLGSQGPHVLNRVINLETGSLAVEAAVKMMLARFYRHDETQVQPLYQGRIPVFLVIGDRAGGIKANYHGTTMFTQFLRGMWPELTGMMEAKDLMLVRPVRINDTAHFAEVLAEYEQPPYKVAGFLHEIVLMNYGGILLEKDYLQAAYRACQAQDVPTLVDEIQSCIWSPEMFMFREYGLTPDFVSVGKGFPGGEYAASRILTTYPMDSLTQFGALVTNGQEELASLAYLVTMKFLEANRDYVRVIGEYYEAELGRLAQTYPDLIQSIEGSRHLSSIFFWEAEASLTFIRALNAAGIDISSQTYKADCPPAVLSKIPLIATPQVVDHLIATMRQALDVLRTSPVDQRERTPG